jgi:hypothetical protein
MSDRHDRWTDAMLAILAPEERAPAGGEVLHRALMRPSFHGTTLITARFGATSTLRLASQVGPWREDEPPVIHEAEATLSPQHAAALRGELEACVPGLDAPDTRVGLDGMTVIFEITDGGARRRIAAWSPKVGDARHTYLARLHATATEVLRDELAQRTLEQLHVYLDLGLPARDHGGAPRRLQIFGHLSSSEEEELARFFARAAADEPVLVDMSNFEGMGTLLYPLFRRFSRRAGATAWVVSPPARKQLEQARVPAEQLFDDEAAARRGLAAVVRDMS